MQREGQILKSLIENQSLTIIEIAKRTRISRTKLYGLYKEDVIEDYYKDRLKRVGIEITQDVNNVNANEQKTQRDVLFEVFMLKEKVELIGKKYDLLMQEIDMLKRMKQDKKQLQT